MAIMEQLHIYNGTLAVIGLCMFIPAAQSVIAGKYSLPILLLTIGGGLMLTGAIHKSIRTDSEEFTLPAARLLLLIALACLSVLVTVISMV
jgi:Zn-dependent protease